MDLAAAMNVLVVNAGSSSLKLRLLDADNSPVASANLTRWDPEDGDAIPEFARDLPPVGAVGHRVVHGGARLTAAHFGVTRPGDFRPPPPVPGALGGTCTGVP